MKVNDINSVSYYVIQRQSKKGTFYLSGYDFGDQNKMKSLSFDPIFHKAIPLTRIEVENFLSRLSSIYFPETIEQGSQLENLAVIELKKTAKCIGFDQFSTKGLIDSK